MFRSGRLAPGPRRPALGGFSLERLDPPIEIAVGDSKQALHFTDVLADALERQRKFFIQAGDPFGDESDIRPQSLGDYVEMAFDVLHLRAKAGSGVLRFDAKAGSGFLHFGAKADSEVLHFGAKADSGVLNLSAKAILDFLGSPIAFLIDETDLGAQAFCDELEMPLNVFSCVAIHRSFRSLEHRALISIVAARPRARVGGAPSGRGLVPQIL
jgi:hypothetical protein